MRTLLSVIACYFLFAACSGLPFYLLDIDPDSAVLTSSKTTLIIFGAVFSIFIGILVRILSKTHSLSPNLGLVLLMCVPAIVSMALTEGSKWSQITVIIIDAPIVIFTGVIYRMLKNIRNSDQ